MGLVKLAVVGVLIISILSWYFMSRTNNPVPELPETWWRPGNENTVDRTVRSFDIVFDRKTIEDLKLRLRRTRDLKPPLKNTGWTYGINNNYLTQRVLDHWLLKYEFKKRETHLNQFPQYKINIQGLDIHFLHVKPQNPNNKRVVPILMQHGWPGSIVEFYKIIPLLTNPREDYDFVFELVAPSLPGFGFSDYATIPGLGSAQMAVVLKNLMVELGFSKFYTQGGDWGAILTAEMGALFPQNVLGIHSNMCVSRIPWTTVKTFLYQFFPSLFFDQEDIDLMYPLKDKLERILEESGYLHTQATKPDSIGVGISDSPAGLAAWILEKFSTATNYTYKQREDGGLLEKFTIDELIDNLMIYWVSNSFTTSARIYSEVFNKNYTKLQLESIPITVPSACAQFPNEIIHQAPTLLKDRFVNLIRVTRMPRGGHFAAMEEPQLLADDVWASINEMEKLR